MATRTIARMYDSYADATAAVRDLEAAGFLHDDISLVGHRAETEATDQTTTETGSGAATGATLGTIIGGGAGLLAGLGTLAIPGIGPIVAAGWLVAALTGAGVGAAAGGLLGGLTGAGVSEEDAHVYAEGVRRGGTLVTVRVDEARGVEAEGILDRHNPVDPATRGNEYRAGGWSRYEEGATTATAAGIGAAGARTMPGTAMPGTGVSGTAVPGTAMPGTMAPHATDDAIGTGVGSAESENAWRHSGVGHGGLAGDPRPGTPERPPGSRTASSAGTGPDGTPGNPPGTMASRGVDDALGTNISGARPENERGTTLGSRDGTPGNPPGTMASRGLDEVAGTNISGAHPENEEDATRNPAGVRPGRGADRTPKR